ncbi:hypothetical protein [Natronomonas amylolytica]|uniref:hypothetical protein n=1 Tax=Natronomonas amylolytica TaxID=3108498 RepID=UPI00300A0CA8
MAHRQTGEENSRAISSSPEKSTDSNGNDSLNRRSFVKGGVAVTATLLASGAGLTAASGSGNGETFTTDYGEYAL